MHKLRRFWRQISLRSKLVALMSMLMILGILVTAVSSAQSLRLMLTAQTDSDLSANSATLNSVMYNAYAGIAKVDARSGLLRFYGDIRDDEGTLKYQLPLPKKVGGQAADIPNLTTAVVDKLRSESPAAITVPGTQPGSAGWRVRTYEMDATGYLMTIGLPLQSVDDTVNKAALLIISTGMLATLLMSMIAYGITSRAFTPLLRVERTAAAIAAGDLSRRVEEYPPETEVGRLSRSLNAMLAHIEHAFRGRAESERKMRRFIQDASHELRTPLVTIQGYSEFYRQGGLADPDQLAMAMGRIEAEAKRMGQLVEDLLLLARLDEQRPLERRPLDLLMLAGDAAEDARVNAPDRVVRLVGLQGGAPGRAPTAGDEPRLRQVVANLMTNALRYTPAGSPMEIAVGVLPVINGRSDAVLEIRDHGPGISEEEAGRVFERFYRADSSRQRETGGSGLGLAIVAAIVKQHDGSIRLNETPGGGATMSIHLPYVPPDSSSTDDSSD
ncbi:sensor histidine kinase [Paeniglutamicibacter cryotolerans]|uniref:histidine kinase n=1 Tax=Paeniglutamicibacter cryotolerans TaxID=670079 RepID=A0A839QGF5_9MICC|nr:HAMP domain-containing sensor histidine kinase [Paeniglutamicibacter cryotolerans]MBB2995408.1 two-component system OmpR family sensor kinase [Paeniglutamicibacter cryotolerans]